MLQSLPEVSNGQFLPFDGPKCCLYTGVPKKVSTENFNSDLLISLIQNFLVTLDSVDM